MSKQRTLKNVIRATGVGLYTGEKVYLTFRPAPMDTGIVFRRIHLDPVVELNAPNPKPFGETRLSTALESDGTRVTKVAQLMSAFAKFAIDNAWIDLTAEEVATDDSTNPFVTIIQSAGIREQNA